MIKNSDYKNIIDITEKKLNINIKSLIALSLIGYVLILTLRYFEGILGTLVEILALYTIADTEFFELHVIIPSLIMIIFWSLIVFKYLKGFDGKVNLSSDLPRLYAKRLIIFTIALLVIHTASFYLMNYLRTLKLSEVTYDYNSSFFIVKGLIISILGFAEVAIIIIGYFKIIRKSTAANKM